MRPRPPAYVRHATPVDVGHRGGCLKAFCGLLIAGFVVGVGFPGWVGLLIFVGFLAAR